MANFDTFYILDGGVNSNELNPLQDVVGLPSQSNENESQVIGSEIIANAHIVASNLPGKSTVFKILIDSIEKK